MNVHPSSKVLSESQNKPSSSQSASQATKFSNCSMIFKVADSFYTSIKENINPSCKPKPNVIGYFDLLPDEILIQVLSLLDMKDLANFCLTNKILCKFFVDTFLLTKSGFFTIVRANQLDLVVSANNKNKLLDFFSSLGMCYCLLFCSTKINILSF